MNFITGRQPQLLSLMRFILGFLMTAHGTQKLLGFPVPSANGTVPLFSFMGFGGALEMVGGILLMLGLFTRITAFILSGQMAVAYFMVHAPQGFWPIVNKGEPAVLYCFAFLYLAAAGGGALSFDTILRERKAHDELAAVREASRARKAS